MNQKKQRRGLGRGLGALIPTEPQTPPPSSHEAANGEVSRETGGTEVDARTFGGTSFSVDASRSHNVGSSSASGTTASPTDSAAGGGEAPEELVAGAYFAELPITSITPNARQPRHVFEEEAMAELVHSIREIGLLQPVVVRRLDEDVDGEAAYELIMGERRWRASQEAGLTEIPAIVRQTEDNDMLRDALLENLHRSELNPLEEASAYGQLLEDFGCTHEELAQRIGRSRPQISNTLRLLKLSPAVQRRVAAGVLSAGHARSLLSVEDPEVQDRLAQRAVAEGISVRGLEEIVAVGDLGGRSRTTRRKPTAPGLEDLGERLSDRFETRVKVDLGKSKGKITVEFASMEDLRRIVDIMDPRNRSDRPI
ncbi:ParB family chromosome partitioning protein [Nocardioides daedukensis]|uniref:ParB family chromosome partitioning protein n=1 Tax=Nocardioides daedukensis TaxID=634462 RepID=A0A7Y9UQL0_9ACTN|nr:ParB/RepB/Spo0J family partition protein [Nocardioides daedukensis]NYG59397.1 ParB family chromosome partitioning protein [Nocardioides daedukensis]